jgi:hypothetical protein
MAQCSRAAPGTTSHQPYDLLTSRQGHDLDVDHKGLPHAVLTRRRLEHQTAASDYRCAPISRVLQRLNSASEGVVIRAVRPGYNSRSHRGRERRNATGLDAVDQPQSICSRIDAAIDPSAGTADSREATIHLPGSQ